MRSNCRAIAAASTRRSSESKTSIFTIIASLRKAMYPWRLSKAVSSRKAPAASPLLALARATSRLATSRASRGSTGHALARGVALVSRGDGRPVDRLAEPGIALGSTAFGSSSSNRPTGSVPWSRELGDSVGAGVVTRASVPTDEGVFARARRASTTESGIADVSVPIPGAPRAGSAGLDAVVFAVVTLGMFDDERAVYTFTPA